MTSVLVQGDQGLVVRRFGCAADGRRAQADIESDGIGASFMRRVCAWCQKDLGVVACAAKDAGMVTHGMCPECLERTLRELPGVKHLAPGGGQENRGRDSRDFGVPQVDAAPLAPSTSPVLPGADDVAAGTGSGQSLLRVNGPAGSVDALGARSQKSDEHAGARPAASSANFDGGKPGSASLVAARQVATPLPSPSFRCVSGLDFGRAIRWARERWRNPLNEAVQAKINQIKEGKKS